MNKGGANIPSRVPLKPGRFFLGTSGWFYKHWKGLFYPDEMKPDQWLKFYAEHFNSVENNSAFYHLPKAKSVENWRDRVPQSFRYAIKCWRPITHYRRLKDAGELLDAFMDRAALLGPKLGAILFQLPPGLKNDLNLLEAFLKDLPQGCPAVFEFRDSSWFHEDTYNLLAHYGAGLCLAHSGGRFPTEIKITSPFIYLRFHGPDRLYASRYGEEALLPWAEMVRNWLSQNRTVFAYFNNDFSGFALEDAKILGSLVQA